MRAAEFVVPTFGYGMREIVGYSENVSSIQREDPHASRIELPVHDATAVGSEAVAQEELFLMRPVGRSVDGRFGTVRREHVTFPVSRRST